MTKRARQYRPKTVPSARTRPVAAAAFALLSFLFLFVRAGAQCPTAIQVLQPISCSGADDGVLTVTPPDGVDAADVYWIQNTDTLFGATQAGLGPGSYLAFIPGCPALGITLNEPFTFFITAEVSLLPTCDAPCSGQITVTPNFGQGDITYSWSHDAAETGPVGSNVCEQVVLVSATDVNGCFDQDMVTVSIPPVEVLTFPTPPSCAGFADGAISAVATGGLGGAFSFEWEDAFGNIVGTSADITGLEAGGYLVTATDTGGCALSQAVFLDAPPPVDVDVTVEGISCFGAADGVASAYFEDAVMYDWSGPGGFTASGADADTVSALSAGIYVVTVTASDGCVGIGEAEVVSPDPLEVTPFLDPPACPGLSDGVVGTVSFGGTPDYTTVWTLPDGSTQTSTFLSGIPAGSYIFETTDANGCATSGAAELEDPAPVAVTIAYDDPACAQGPLSEQGGLEALPSGGLPPYDAVWVNASSGEVVSLGLSATNLAAGVYGLGLLDAMGCLLDTVVALEAPDSLLVDIASSDPACAGESSGGILASASGGTPDYNYLWTGDVAATLSPELSNMGAGSYALEVTDANGCQVTAVVGLEDPEPLSVEVETVLVGCAGSDGGASASPSGGNPPYGFVWTDASGIILSNADSVGGLAPGTVNLSLTDANGCSTTLSTEVGSLPPLTLDADVAIVDCETGHAALTAAAAGGAPPLTLVLSEAGSEVDSDGWNDLPPGDYTLQVTDQRGCAVDVSFFVYPPITVSAAVVPFGCAGGGTIAVSAAGGDPASPLVIEIPALGPPASEDPGFASWASIPEGVYFATVSDGACTVETLVEMTGVELFDWSIEVTPFACEGAAGGISAAVTGGALPLLVTGSAVDGSTTWSVLDTTGLAPGAYTLSVLDAAGCQRDTVLEVGALAELELDATVTDVFCPGADDGELTLLGAGGAAPLVFGANGPSGLVVAPFEGLSPGTYTAGVVDARGCTADTIVEVAAPAAFQIETALQPESCSGTADGAAQVTAAGGTGSLQVQWTGGPASETWSGLVAGTYTWTVSDANGCDTTGTAEIETLGGVDAVAEVLPGTCADGISSGTVVITITGNPGSADVLLGGLPADETGLTDTTATWTWNGLAAGNYGWTASLGATCASAGQVQVDLPAPLQFLGLADMPACEGGTGAVLGNPTGGTAPLASSWTGMTTAGDTLVGSGSAASALPAGTYVWTLSDAAGCALDTTISLVPTSSGLGLDMALTQPSCGGALAGAATLDAFGGIPPYAVVVQGAADSVFLPFLVPGPYPLTLIDSIGCTYLDTIVIDAASDFVLFAAVDSASCANSEDGQIALSTENGTGSVDYTFSGPFGAVATGDTISGVGAGIYEVTALDDAGCPAVLLVEVLAPPAVTVVLDTLDRPSCSGDEDGLLAVSVSGGAGAPFTVNWYVEGEFLAEGAVQADLGEGQYAVEALDAQGCAAQIASIPLVAEGDVVLTVPPDTALCAGTPLELEALSDGATEAYWALPDGANGVGLSAQTAAVSEGLAYWVYTAIRLGCVREDSVAVTGFALPTPDAGQDAQIASGATAGLGAGGATEEWTYAWFPSADVAFPESATTPTNPLFSTTTFLLEATTANGCTAVDTALVEVLQELDIPSGFTPNGDGVNDQWNLSGVDQYPSAEITVFNRWGDVLFTRGVADGSWDGTLNGTAVPVGTYYYHIRVEEPAIQTEWTGPITIMR